MPKGGGGYHARGVASRARTFIANFFCTFPAAFLSSLSSPSLRRAFH